MIGSKGWALPFLLLPFLLASCGVPQASAVEGQSAFTWQRDCAGQFEFELPGKVDLPIPRWADVIENWKTYAFVPESTYNAENKFLGTGDETYKKDTHAWGSKQEIAGASIFPGPNISLEDFALLQRGIARAQEDRRSRLKNDLGVEDTDKLNVMPGATKDSFIWEYRLSRDLFLWRGGHTFLYREGGRLPAEQIAARVKHVIDDMRPRDTFDVPKDHGLCVQGGFLPEMGNPHRVVGVTYRLRDHPEVEIFFEERTAQPHFHSNGTAWSAEEEVRFFWEDNYSADDKQHKLLNPHVPGVVQFPNATIGGYKGKASFVELTHKDDSIDYGYMAFVLGEADGGKYRPTMMLYVIRTASRAIGEPLSKDQIKEMAERIAASVRSRQLSQ